MAVQAARAYVIGVAPGLNALAYAVLEIEPAGRPSVVDHDVLHARPLSPESFRNPQKRSRIHQMVLGVVAERYPPRALALGPVVDPTEEPEHVQASRDVLTAMAALFGFPLVNYESRGALCAALHAQSLGRRLKQLLAEPLDSRDRRIILAAAAALAAARSLAPGR